MKIVLLNTFETKGGAAIACKRLMIALQKQGIDVKLVVRDKSTKNLEVITVNRSFIGKLVNFIRFGWERLCIFSKNKLSTKNLFAVSLANTGNDVSRLSAVKDADIIHLHWINQGFLSLKDIQKLIDLNKPIVWTMHDMWAYTGICHHSRQCVNYMDSCGNCFFLLSPRTNDLSHKVFCQKQKYLYRQPLNLVGCSEWIAGLAKTSALTVNSRVISIPNPIDVDEFKVLDKKLLRKQLNLPLDRKLILFGAANISDKRKGINYLRDSLVILKNIANISRDKIDLVVFGNAEADFYKHFPFHVHYMGYIPNNKKLIDIYNVADVFVTPSLEDNLPNMIMESMSCGTPCVGFDIGGIPEMIDHKDTGYLAEYKSANDLAEGIRWVLFDSYYNKLSDNSRKKAIKLYSEDIVSKQYIGLYNNLLNDHEKPGI